MPYPPRELTLAKVHRPSLVWTILQSLPCDVHIHSLQYSACVYSLVNCLVSWWMCQAGPNYMRLKWRPPSVDGNSPVTDYEVSFSRKLVTKVRYTYYLSIYIHMHMCMERRYWSIRAGCSPYVHLYTKPDLSPLLKPI